MQRKLLVFLHNFFLLEVRDLGLLLEPLPHPSSLLSQLSKLTHMTTLHVERKLVISFPYLEYYCHQQQH